MTSSEQSESERQTRRTRVDPLLKAQGWTVAAFDEDRQIDAYGFHALTEFSTAHGPADYALIANGQVLGIVEAKKVSLSPQGVLTQAERYSKGVTSGPFEFEGRRVPFLYSTNGETIWFQDVRHPLEVARKIASFHTPAALAEMISRDLDAACARLGETPNEHSRLRPYQIDANAAVEAAIRDRKRQMLVAMATGTGKTFTLVNQIYRLMKSEVGRRVLFLVDRRALAAQAVRAFASFEPEPNKKFDKLYEVYSERFRREDFGEEDRFDPKVLPSTYLTKPHAKHAFVYVCTIQRMAINLFGRQVAWSGDGDTIDDDADRIDIPINAFDVIIADECHRGYTTAEESLWRNTLDHFDAIKIGLTATPAAHTKAYFHDVVYRYEYARAVREGYLVDYDVVSITSDVRMNGMFLKSDERIEIVDPDTGNETLDRLEDERDFGSEDVERKVTSPDSNRKILEEIKKYALEHEQEHGRFPKTLIFAANDLPHTSHADQLVKEAVDLFGRGQSFVRKITGRVDRPLQAIREFRNRPSPGIAVTVDLLSTGVDIPDLEFIVFLRQVKSRILFEQMLGRGTRKGEKFPDKSHFTVFDCFDGTLIRYFREATAITADAPLTPGRTIPEIIEEIWKNQDRDYNIRCLVRRLQRIDKEMAGEARTLFEAHGIPNGDVGSFAADLPAHLRNDFMPTMAVLRNEALQDLLMDYPRAKRSFFKAVEYEDNVSSEWLIRDGRGHELKPEDYLAAFSRFVLENPAKIEAITILLGRPKAWGMAALSELRTKLTAAPERFTIENLQRAHRIRYAKALADIISMVKHAAKETEPLLTAEERVDRAVKTLAAGREFSDEQLAWLDRIREHLIVNLSIDREDFEVAPILSRAGGWNPADRAFMGHLAPLLQSLNEAIAA
jgi:type I restriction enzyme R subunit